MSQPEPYTFEKMTEKEASALYCNGKMIAVGNGVESDAVFEQIAEVMNKAIRDALTHGERCGCPHVGKFGATMGRWQFRACCSKHDRPPQRRGA